jgi:hypothetical protein
VTIAFVFSNPRHHVEMMVPVARVLERRGVRCELISLAELRGLRTAPIAGFESRLRRVMPALRRDPAMGAGVGLDGDGAGSTVRRLAREALWRGVVAPRLRWLTRGADAVVVPNDAAYPYRHVAESLVRRGVPFALLQEGTRYVTPKERAGAEHVYGRGGAAAVCVWGEASAEHFRAIGVPAGALHVTGNPRFDDVDPAAWAERGAALVQRLGFARSPLIYLSSPIDDLGFCSTRDKLELFAGFLRAAMPVLRRDGRGLIVKLHAREAPEAYRAIIAEQAVPDAIVVDGEPLFTVLAAGRAAVIVSSTVGLEALCFGLPLGVVAIPGHGHVFDYVSSGAAIGLDPATIADGVAALLAQPRDAAPPHVAAFLERHMAFRGGAAGQVADRVAAITA